MASFQELIRRFKSEPSGGGNAEARLVKSPTFVITSVRSGSTMFRMILDTHSEIYAPTEMHLTDLRVGFKTAKTPRAMKALGLEKKDLEYALWDRIMDLQLRASGKRYLVDKTPGNVFVWEKLAEAWPSAKFIFLLRHPQSVFDSVKDSYQSPPTPESIVKYLQRLEEARNTLDGLTVRYEDIVSAPEREMRTVCKFLGVEYEPGMLDYGKQSHGEGGAYLGDWMDKIKTGTIQESRALPSAERVLPVLRPYTEKWGY